MDLEYIEYLIKENDKIVKYSIEYDIETLNKLRKEICIKCGIRKHIIEEQAGTRIYKEDFLLENIKSEFIRKEAADYDYYEYYKMDYYLINEPSLSIIIKNFIKGDITDLVILLHYNILKDNKIDFDYENKQLMKRVDHYMKNDNIDKSNELLKQISENNNSKKYNKKLNLIDQKDYILKLKSLLIINKKDEMNYEDYRKFISFTKKLNILEIKK